MVMWSHFINDIVICISFVYIFLFKMHSHKTKMHTNSFTLCVFPPKISRDYKTYMFIFSLYHNVIILVFNL